MIFAGWGMFLERKNEREQDGEMHSKVNCLVRVCSRHSASRVDYKAREENHNF